MHGFAIHKYPSYYDDWVNAADEENKDFKLISGYLENYGCFYGAMPAHSGMWRTAEDTANDLIRRFAVVPMALEACSSDVTLGMIAF